MMTFLPARLPALLLGGLLALWLAACTTTTVTGKGHIKEKTPEEQVAVLVSTATTYLANQNPQRAKELMRRALEIDAKSPEAHHVLAMAFWQTLELDLAEEHFRKALGYKPAFSQANLNYAVFLLNAGRAKEARRYIDRVLEDTLYEQRPKAFFYQGRILLSQGELAPSIEAFRRALALDRTNVLAMFGLAAAYYQAGDYAQADRHFQQYRLNAQSGPDALLLGIRIAEKTGNQDAKASYELALKNMYPDSAEAKQYFQPGKQP